jgi:hypothetical protein
LSGSEHCTCGRTDACLSYKALLLFLQEKELEDEALRIEITVQESDTTMLKDGLQLATKKKIGTQ